MTIPNEFAAFALHLNHIAAREILPHFRTPFAVDNKLSGGFDPVTIADRNVEAAIRREIRRTYPDHGIIGEEYGTEEGSSPYTWLIDPIDGTRAFVLGQLYWGTLLALSDGSRPVLGSMHQPFTGETFLGTAEQTELLHHKVARQLTTRRGVVLRDATICATSPTMFETPELAAAFARVAAKARSVRYGGDCYTACLVAAGCADLVIEASLKPWDVQPLIPIIEGAGGVITDWSGGDATSARQVVIAGSRELHAEVMEVLEWGRQ